MSNTKQARKHIQELLESWPPKAQAQGDPRVLDELADQAKNRFRNNLERWKLEDEGIPAAPEPLQAPAPCRALPEEGGTAIIPEGSILAKLCDTTESGYAEGGQEGAAASMRALLEAAGGGTARAAAWHRGMDALLRDQIGLRSADASYDLDGPWWRIRRAEWALCAASGRRFPSRPDPVAAMPIRVAMEPGDATTVDLSSWGSEAEQDRISEQLRQGRLPDGWRVLHIEHPSVLLRLARHAWKILEQDDERSGKAKSRSAKLNAASCAAAGVRWLDPQEIHAWPTADEDGEGGSLFQPASRIEGRATLACPSLKVKVGSYSLIIGAELPGADGKAQKMRGRRGELREIWQASEPRLPEVEQRGQTLAKVLEESSRRYADSIFPTVADAARHMWLVIGNGYSWVKAPGGTKAIWDAPSTAFEQDGEERLCWPLRQEQPQLAWPEASEERDSWSWSMASALDPEGSANGFVKGRSPEGKLFPGQLPSLAMALQAVVMDHDHPEAREAAKRTAIACGIDPSSWKERTRGKEEGELLDQEGESAKVSAHLIERLGGLQAQLQPGTSASVPLLAAWGLRGLLKGDKKKATERQSLQLLGPNPEGWLLERGPQRWRMA